MPGPTSNRKVILKRGADFQYWLNLFAALVLFVVVFFSQFRLVGAEPSEGTAIDTCSGRGYKNATTGLCNCINNYYGYNCHLKLCPFGKSWLSIPKTNQLRNREYVACSNMGDCSPLTGLCLCRPGYEGRACERLACASRTVSMYNNDGSINPTNYYTDGSMSSFVLNPSDAMFPLTLDFSSDVVQRMGGVFFTTEGLGMTPGPATSSTPPWSLGDAIPCSGHGLCMSMAEAAANWNGLNLLRPPVTYTNWEADAMQGCLCDYGWGGYDCASRMCPFGRDPQDTNPKNKLNEKFLIRCAATQGYFSLQILGLYTKPIPFDADTALLQGLLQEIPNVGRVQVVMQADATGEPSACSSTGLLTTFTLLDRPGPQLPIRVVSDSGASRMFPDSGTVSLSNAGNATILYMVTNYFIACPVCSGCTGKIYLSYGDSISSAIDITTSSSPSLITTALGALTNLTSANYPGLSISVTSSIGSTASVCKSDQSHTLTISLSSTIGNIPGLSLIDSSFSEDATFVSLGFGTGKTANITMTSNLGTGTLYECSNQGICDRRTGQCQCTFAALGAGALLSDRISSKMAYQASASDGNGNPGGLGDCGYLTIAGGCDAPGGGFCSGHGFCSNSTGRCECYDGWKGVDCSTGLCPFGPAWFDEATAPSVAHAPAECSNMGLCDRATRICSCRAGFTGQACNVKDCVRDVKTGEPCGGHGYCESMASLFSLYGFNYGSVRGYAHSQPQAWDATSWHECICYAKYGVGALAHPLRPAVSARTAHSGYSAGGGSPLPGWGGWNCASKLCPRGDDIDKFNLGRSHSGITLPEQQRVVCSMSAGWTGSNDTFRLEFLGWETADIGVDSSAAQIKKAIEYAATIGNVTVAFPNFAYDNISTACSTFVNQTAGGFFVQFNTEVGDVPLLKVHNNASVVSVTEVVKGTSSNLECGGPSQGYCDRDTGLCVCAPHRWSSNGNGSYGANGDCAAFQSEVSSSDRPSGVVEFDGTYTSSVLADSVV